VARTVRAAIPFGPNLDEHGHVEQGQMAKAHDRIQPMQVANLPTAAAAPGPFNGALDADEPVPLLGSLCGEDANLGQVQRNLNDIVHSDSHREPGPQSSHKGAPSLYYTCSPSRQFRESQEFLYLVDGHPCVQQQGGNARPEPVRRDALCKARAFSRVLDDEL